jgi:hypothetical protein
MAIPNQKKERIWNDPPIPGESVTTSCSSSLTVDQIMKSDGMIPARTYQIFSHLHVGVYALLFGGFIYCLMKVDTGFTPKLALQFSVGVGLINFGLGIYYFYKNRN